jgi:diguanylate cyclase (GGDEF)-like protein
MQIGSLAESPVRSVCCLPLTIRSKTRGCLYLDTVREPRPFSEETVRLLQALSDHAAVAIDNARLREEVIFDATTGLASHRYFEVRAGHEVSRAVRHGTPLSLILVDLDYFKSVNDTLGHQVGTQLLKDVAVRVRDCLRSTDTAVRLPTPGTDTQVGRYGGDEFEILLPDTDWSGAMLVAERIRARVRDLPFRTEGGGTLRITASVGVSSFPTHAKDWGTLFLKADEALYEAKRGGRDQIRTAAQGPDGRETETRRIPADSTHIDRLFASQLRAASGEAKQEIPPELKDVPAPSNLDELRIFKQRARERAEELVELAFVQGLLTQTGGNLSEAARKGGIDTKWIKSKLARYSIDTSSFKSPPPNGGTKAKE